jgi:DNA repair protein SbcD/Mre11
MLKVLHLSDVHLGSGLSHGKINHETGLNTRFEDFVKCLCLCIDRAISDPVDLVLFGGDAFPDATPLPYIQEAFATQFRRLADAEIPTVLLVGNHDQHSQGQGGASLSIYRTLAVPKIIVGDTISTHLITTKNGDCQVITLPWVNRSVLLTRKDADGLSMTEVNKLLVDRLHPALEGEIRRLNPDIPTILLGHLMAENALLGAERLLAVGKGFTVPMGLLIRPEFDYVALGHVHKHQNLNSFNNPPVVYPGSIERVDFSEEKEEKGYVMINLEKGDTTWEFCPLPARIFKTIKVDVCKAEFPQDTILKKIAQHDIKDAVIRLIYTLESEQLEKIENSALHKALSDAHSYTIQTDLVSQLSRPRIPELDQTNSIDPISALKTYLDNHPKLQDLADLMLEAAEKLLVDNQEDWGDNEESMPINSDQLILF